MKYKMKFFWGGIKFTMNWLLIINRLTIEYHFFFMRWVQDFFFYILIIFSSQRGDFISSFLFLNEYLFFVCCNFTFQLCMVIKFSYILAGKKSDLVIIVCQTKMHFPIFPCKKKKRKNRLTRNQQ